MFISSFLKYYLSLVKLLFRNHRRVKAFYYSLFRLDESLIVEVSKHISKSAFCWYGSIFVTSVMVFYTGEPSIFRHLVEFRDFIITQKEQFPHISQDNKIFSIFFYKLSSFHASGILISHRCKICCSSVCFSFLHTRTGIFSPLIIFILSYTKKEIECKSLCDRF